MHTQKDIEEPMPGYLSLHQTAAGLVIKWTPNQLMNGYAESEGIDKRYVCILCSFYLVLRKIRYEKLFMILIY